MAKIDILTLTGFTASDGSVIASGATVKFGSEFQIGTTSIIIRPKVFRTRELFEAGYMPIDIQEIPRDFRLSVPEADYYVITPQILYGLVCDYLNTLFGEIVFEVVVIP